MGVGSLARARVVRTLGVGCATVGRWVVGPSNAAATNTVDMLRMTTTTQPTAAVARLADPSIGACERRPRTSDIKNAMPRPTTAVASRLTERLEANPSRKKLISR
jgi:hypothetical protein